MIRKLQRFLQEMFNKLYSFKMPVFKWTLGVRKLKGCGGLQKLQTTRWIPQNRNFNMQKPC